MSETSHHPNHGTNRTVDRSERHRLLADEQRLTAVEVLTDRGPTTLSELARAIADHDRTDDRPPANVRVQLHHVHLPMLDDAGVIDYERDANRAVPFHAIHDLRP